MVDAVLYLSVHEGRQVVYGVADTVVGNASLRIVVGAYLCGAVACRDHRLTLRGNVVEVLLVLFVINKGVEISNGVYKTKAGGMHVLPITEVVPKTDFFDYDAKYNGLVEEITPARLSEDTTKRVQALTAAIYDILGASGIIRIDYIISKNEAGDDVINMLEINTTPGMTPTSFISLDRKSVV